MISWPAATDYVGQTVTVEETIYTCYASDSRTTFLGFHYPYEGYFYGVVLSGDSGSLKCCITGFSLNKEVRITGTIQSYNGATEITVRSPSQIEVASKDFHVLNVRIVTRELSSETFSVIL